jgi:hypothetical protein
MAELSFPFDAGAGANVQESQWRKMAGLWLPSGVFREGNVLAVSPGAGLAVNLATGKAWVNGHYYENDAILAKAIGAPDGANPRIDRIILRADYVNNQVLSAVKAGVPAASPSPPALTDDATMREISLAQLLVNVGDAGFVAADITDERVFTPPYQTLYDEEVLAADVASVIMSGIPPTYRDLEVTAMVRGSAAQVNSLLYGRFNNDTTAANYAYEAFWGASSSVFAGAADSFGQMIVGEVAGNNATASRPGIARLYVPGYAKTDFHKLVVSTSGSIPTATLTEWRSTLLTALWKSAVAINRLDLYLNSGNLRAGGLLRYLLA